MQSAALHSITNYTTPSKNEASKFMSTQTAQLSERPMGMKWFVVHTYSGHENKARLSLQERIKQMGKEAQFGQILIPTESVLELVKGQRRTTTRKFYPGYMFVQMEL